MKKKIAAICLCFMLTGSAFAASSREDLQARIDAAKLVLDQIMGAGDRSVPLDILQQATCVAVVPGMIKGAFVFGAQYGQGVVTCRTGHGWSAPVFIRMAGGSWGLQIGGQSTDLILIAVNERGFQDLLKNKFKIGGDASAAAGPGGARRNSVDGLEDECGVAQLFAQQGAVCGDRFGRDEREPELGRHGDLLRRAA
jgi:SH3 domain-containing YSC84-like protein 1